MPDPVRVAVVGTGMLGSVHARVLSELEEAELVGVLDTDGERASEVSSRHGVPVLGSLEELRQKAQAAVIAVPTTHHHEVAAPLLSAGIACLVEKPLARTPEEGRDLVRLAEASGACLMTGHVERFNPAVVALLEHELTPRYVEAHRVSPFAFRSADIGVVQDLMIHDIDLMLHLVPSEVSAVHAVGVGVIGDPEDLANARILFENGAVANATASRMALKKERKLRLFAPDCYVSLDLLARTGRILRPGPNLKQGLKDGTIDLAGLDPIQVMMQNLVRMEELKASDEEPLVLEDREFLAAITEKRPAAVTGLHGVRAIETARRVVDSIQENLDRASP